MHGRPGGLVTLVKCLIAVPVRGYMLVTYILVRTHVLTPDSRGSRTTQLHHTYYLDHDRVTTCTVTCTGLSLILWILPLQMSELLGMFRLELGQRVSKERCEALFDSFQRRAMLRIANEHEL